jgi:hypothetical protein
VEAIDERPDLTSLAGTGLLIEPEVDAAVDPRVVDVPGNFRERRVMEHDVRHRRVRQRDRVVPLAEDACGHRPGGVARGRVRGGVAGETR